MPDRTSDTSLGVAVNLSAAVLASGFDVQLFALIAAFAFFGSTMRLLYRWTPGVPIQRRIGIVGSSVFGALLIGLATYDQLRLYPTMHLALTGSVGWIGFDAIESVSRRLLGMQKGPGDA